jgi:hypothetical protein
MLKSKAIHLSSLEALSAKYGTDATLRAVLFPSDSNRLNLQPKDRKLLTDSREKLLATVDREIARLSSVSMTKKAKSR